MKKFRNFNAGDYLRIGILVGITLLAACAEVVGNDIGGTVENTSSASESFRMAEEHCAKYSKKARIVQSAPGTAYSARSMTFNCV